MLLFRRNMVQTLGLVIQCLSENISLICFYIILRITNFFHTDISALQTNGCGLILYPKRTVSGKSLGKKEGPNLLSCLLDKSSIYKCEIPEATCDVTKNDKDIKTVTATLDLLNQGESRLTYDNINLEMSKQSDCSVTSNPFLKRSKITNSKL